MVVPSSGDHVWFGKEGAWGLSRLGTLDAKLEVKPVWSYSEHLTICIEQLGHMLRILSESN